MINVPLETVLLSLESGARPKGGVSADSGDIPSIGGEHLTDDGGFDFTNIKRIPMYFFKKMRSGHVVPLDILIVKDGATTGKTSFVRSNFPFREAAVNEHVFCVRVNPEKASPIYIYHFLRSTEGQKAIQLDFRGATVGGISREFTAKTVLPLPSLPEQQRIADILDRVETLRAKRRAALAQLDELSQSIFLEIFGDPVKNPKGWSKRPFGDVCVSRLGKMLDQKQQTGKHLRPYLRNANVQWFHFDLIDVFKMDFNEAARKEFRLEDGDLLICEGGEPGRAAIWKGELEECYYQKALHCARPHQDLANSEYLAWLLWFFSARGGLGDHVTAATIAHLTGEKLKAMKIPLPPISLQKEFARRVEAVEKLKTAHKASLAELNELFTSLQYRAFRGEL